MTDQLGQTGQEVHGGRVLTTLQVDGRTVATYVDGTTLEPTLSRRPFLHPVTTPAGTATTDLEPEDHRWHLGVSVAVQDVDGINVWGGRTYVRDQGYLWRPDHGSITHEGWEALADDAFDERLTWRDPDGATLLQERRAFAARTLAGAASGWLLDISFDLHNPSGTDLQLGSPATNGREGGGYGGLFWRLPGAAGPATVFTPTAEGEDAVHGTRAPWVAYSGDDGDADRPFTVVLVARDERTMQDAWFVRLSGYPGLCSALATEEPLVVPAGGTQARRLSALVVDGHLGAEQVAGLAGPLAARP